MQESADEATIVEHGVPQQNISYADNLGRRSGIVVWTGTLKVDSQVTLRQIISELNSYKHGSLRDATTGVLAAPKLKMIRPGILTDSYGAVISKKAIIDNWRFVGRTQRITGSPFNFLVQLIVQFKTLE